jgi:Cu(I)/Ag(I) efflux system membrane fusion protein
MNKRVIVVSVLVIAIFLVFRFCNTNKPEQKADIKPEPLAMAENSGSFNQSFNALLDAYYSLKNAFVEADTEAVNKAAGQLTLHADSLKINEIQGDTSGMIKETAQYFTGAISSSGKNIAVEGDIEAKRKEFNMITDAMWNLTRTVHYDAQKVYYQYCAMAFDNTGAYWLSDKIDDNNPYTGKKTPNCGEVTDSLDYSKK